MRTRSQEVSRRRFTVHDYHKMAEAGILHEDDRVELIEGEIVEMAAIGGRHFTCVNKLNHLLVKSVGDAAIVSVQNPVRLDERNEPQPDLAVIRAGDYREALPGPEDVLFLIEVSDTTLAYDRNTKLPLYARAGVSEAWIVNLANETAECHTDPSPDGYRTVRHSGKGDTIKPEAFPELTISVNAVFE